jgi:hypothetical protein
MKPFIMGEYIPTPYDDNTPVSVARAIIDRLQWDVDEVVLEPARGAGAFYDNLPGYVKKHWCEIMEGRDFFAWQWPVDTVITNPPFNERKQGRGLIMPFLEHSFTIARKRVVFLVSHAGMKWISVERLDKYGRQGWGLSQLGLVHTKKFRIMMFLWIFQRGYHGDTHLFWDKTRYDA